MTQFNTIDRSDRYKFEILKFQDGGGSHLEKSKNCHNFYLGRSLSYFD